jgi:predicted methyltransferase
MPGKILSLLKKYQSSRPLPRRNLDQFYATPETTAKRAALLQQNGDIRGKRLLFLGDDDLVSIAAAATHQTAEITAIDIDQRILDFINFIKQKEKFRIRTLKYDVRHSLPKQLWRRADICFFDPPYTPNGFRLFLSRAIDALSKDGKLYFCYGYSLRSRERVLPIQQIITAAGIVIEEKIPNFNEYRGAASIGNQSSLYICYPTPKTRTLVEGEFKGPIYSGITRLG